MKSISLIFRRSRCGVFARGFATCAAIAFAMCFCVSMARAFSKTTLTGSIQNWTTGLPSAGDDVLLLRVANGVQEEMRVTTDTHGTFRISEFDPSLPHLVRVIHEGVSYDQALVPGETFLRIPVFDTASRVRNVRGNVTIYRMEPQGNMLHVTELDAVRNESSPPQTETGENTFQFYLPPQARIISARGAAPSGTAQQIAPRAIDGADGKYALSFPLQPGETRFAINYDLPYAGKASFHPRLSLPVHQLAVMVPQSVHFTPRGEKGFLQLSNRAGMEIREARNVKTSDDVAFDIAGSGGASAGSLPSRIANQTGTLVATVREPLEFAICLSASTFVAAIGVLLSLWVKSRRLTPIAQRTDDSRRDTL